MIITRFGDTSDMYAGAYVLPTLKGEQPQEATRTPVTATVSGADGAFDFFGAQPFPLAAKELTLKGELHGASYADISTQLLALKQATVGRGEALLWGEERNGAAPVPILWARAKCNAVQDGEAAGKNFINYPVSMAFWLSEGVWYSEDPVVNTYSRIGNLTVLNGGSYANAPINVVWTAGTAPIIFLNIRRMLGEYIAPAPTPYFRWTENGASVTWNDTTGDGIVIGSTLSIDSDALSVLDGVTVIYPTPSGWPLVSGGTDAYAAGALSLLTLGTGQVGWLTMNLRDWSSGSLARDDYLQIAAYAGGNVTVANTTPIQITTGVAHGLSNGARVRISATGVTDGSFIVTVTGPTTFTLDGTSASGTGTGRWRWATNITAVSVTGAPITVTTGIAHGLSDGDVVFIRGTNTNADGVWEVANATTYTVDLVEDYTGTAIPGLNTTAYGGSGGVLHYNPGASGLAFWYQAFV